MLSNADLLRALRSYSLKTSWGIAIVLLVCSGAARAQATPSAVPDRLVQPIDEKARVKLTGTVHRLANQANDRGAVADGLKLDRLQIVLKRSDKQEADLKQLVSDLHAPGNANYHKWLTPDDFGKRFGPSDADLAKLSAWLQTQGFAVTKLNPGRQTLEVTGSAGQFRDAFKAQIHTYQVKSTTGEGMETHYANAADPQIPAALAPVFGGFVSLNNFKMKTYARKLGEASYNPVTHMSKPEWTVGSGSDISLALSPADFAVQYSIPSQTTAGTNDGTGQSIAIVNISNINVALVNRYRTLFGLPANPPQVIIDGNDPGVDGINNPDGENGASVEAYLDVEQAGAIAPAAQVNLVIAADTAIENGLYLAAERAVYSNISPVISLSIGECELGLESTNTFWSGLWEQAAAQGITVLTSSGDSGSAACDNPDSQAFAVYGQQVSGLASTPYNLAVGGTDFYYAGGAGDYGTYWNLTPSNDAPKVSLLKPVPEQPWNESQYGTNIFNYSEEFSGSTPNTSIAAGSGGASNCATGAATQDGGYDCSGGYAKPSWQKGTGVPNDSVRDIPDVSLFASSGANNSYYPICAEDGDCEPVAATGSVQIFGVGGTSASAPSFAGIMALVNQQYGRQGQAGFVLYPMATQYPAAFNDIAIGAITVPCNLETVSDGTYDYPPTNCQAVADEILGSDPTFGTSPEGEVGLAAGVPAYNAGTGYDLATGLGTVNVSTLLSDWGKVTFAGTTVTLTPSATSFAHGTAVTISGTVTGTGTPTGDVALETDSTTPLNAALGGFTLANGSYSGSLNFLPGGTYNIWGNYGGDNANSASSSIVNKVQVTVTPEASTTALTLRTLNQNTGAYEAVATGTTVSYGEQVVLGAIPSPSSGAKNDSTPTGNVVFSNGSATVNTAVLNAEGDAEYFGTYPVSATPYSIKAAYSGDSSYTGSTSTATSFSVVQNTPVFTLFFPNQDNAGDVIGPQQSAVTVVFENSNQFTQNALAPTGTLTVTGLPTATKVTLSSAIDPLSGSPEGVGLITFPAGMTSGTLNLSFAYSGDNNYAAVTTPTYSFPYVSAGAGVASTTAVTASATATSPAAAVQVTTTVTGQSGKPAPTGTIQIYGPPLALSEQVAYFGQYTLPTVSSGDSVTYTITVDSEGFLQGSNQLTVQYSGDSNYLPSSGTITVSNPLSDFQMVPLSTILSVPTSGTASDTINLSSTNSFAGAVALTCTASGGVTCSLNPASTTLTAGGSSQVSLTVNSTGVTAVGTYNVVVTGTDPSGQYIHTLGFQVAVPALATGGGSGTGTIAVIAPAITVASQGASGTSTVTVTPSGGFTGSVALSCAITASPSGATDIPTCALTPPTVDVSSAAAVTTTLSVNTTAQTTSQLRMLFSFGGGATMAALWFIGGPLVRRGRLTLNAVRTIRLLSSAVLFALIAGAAMGCGGGSSSTGSGGGGGGGTPTGGTTPGLYTVTITATPSSGTAVTTNVAVTVN